MQAASFNEADLVRRHAPQVRKAALRLMTRLPASVELDDLVQAGMLGLLDAIRRYRRMPQAQFETYAMQRVRGAMFDELRRADWLPRSLRDKSRRLAEAVQAAQRRLGRAPTEQEIAQEMKVDVQTYQSLLQQTQGAQVLYAEDLASGFESGADPESAGLGQAGGSDPLGQALLGDLRQVLAQAIDQLPERERLLLSLLYQEEMNVKEVALVMGVTPGRVCQLRTQAVGRIRAYLTTKGWADRPASLGEAAVF